MNRRMAVTEEMAEKLINYIYGYIDCFVHHGPREVGTPLIADEVIERAARSFNRNNGFTSTITTRSFASLWATVEKCHSRADAKYWLSHSYMEVESR